DSSQHEAIEEDYRRDIEQIEVDRAFLHKCNTGGEYMQLGDQQHVKNIGARTWANCDGKREVFLSENEMYNLQVSRGTLTAEEREVINNHIVVSIKMLDALPFPRYMEKVPEYAGGHHERMDGTGYPNGLTREQMSIPARIMAIADIFEALTAADRPYKKAKPLSETLKILGFMKLSHHIDPDLFDVFINEKLYLDYARQFMAPELIDIEEPNEIPGYPFTLEENELI
ncbi:MAG: HD domain-containing phosphohydrolase, partial [Mariprofundaceae bacterium]|nr:HD domain-containing phosphohydrolase [Mariprofundaceae bacterium]